METSQIVKQIDNRNTKGNGTDYNIYTNLCFNSFGNQIKANHTQHNPCRKAEKQTNGSVGILLQNSTNNTAKTGANHPCNGGG